MLSHCRRCFRGNTVSRKARTKDCCAIHTRNTANSVTVCANYIRKIRLIVPFASPVKNKKVYEWSRNRHPVCNIEDSNETDQARRTPNTKGNQRTWNPVECHPMQSHIGHHHQWDQDHICRYPCFRRPERNLLSRSNEPK